MNTIQRLKSITPRPVWNLTRRTALAARLAAQWPRATFHPWRRESIRRLAALKNAYRGQRCFIIGNGPSLQHTNVSLLKNEFTFGLNRIYLAFEEWGFQTSFLVSVNDLVVEQCVDDFLELNLPRFFSWRSRHFFSVDSPLDALPTFLHTTYIAPIFGEDARRRLWEGGTVTYVALQLAFYMGFQQVILIGVDHSFATQGKPNTTVVSQGDDPNHFSPGYFGKGFRWQLPDLESSEMAYRMAKKAYQENGREVIDATIGGKLAIFPKRDYASLF